MRNLIVVGLAVVLGGCCCRSQRVACCAQAPSESEAARAIAASVEDDHFIGDLVLARLEQRSQKGMDDARAAVVAAVREVVGSEVELRAWWSVLHVTASPAKQAHVGRALALLRVEAGGESASVAETYDVAALLKTLPVVTAMGPGTQKEIRREATLFEALYFDLGLAEGAPGPGMRLRAGILTVTSSAATQAKMARSLKWLRGEVASVASE